MRRKLLSGEINILLISVLVIILASALWIFLTSLVPEKYGFPGVTHYEKEGYDIYTSLMPTTTDLFSANGINSFIKVKNEEIKEFSFQSGTYLKFKDKPIIKISKPVDMSLKFVSENEITFSINGKGSTSIYLYNLNPDFSYTVKRDGKIFTDWQLVNSTMFIYTELSEHIFEIFGTNESILWNKANDSISVYLLMKIQFYNSSSGEWIDENIVYQSSNPINLSVNETIKLEDYFNGKWNTSQASHGSGLYRVWAAALDEKGDTIINKDGSLALSTYNFTISDTIPPTISNITVSAITGSTATITWNTDEPSTSQIEYGLTTSYGSSTSLDTNLVTEHTQTITGLTSNTTYHFRVKSKDASNNEAVSEDNIFTTTEEINLVAYYKFDEGSGTTAYDSSENGNNGTIYGASWIDGKMGKALRFNGSNNYVEIPSSPTLNSITSQITIIAWIKTNFSQRGTIVENWYYDKTVTPQIGERAYICTAESGADAGKFEFGLSPYGNGSGGVWLKSNTAVTPNQWVHVAFVSNATNMSIYINGSLDATTSAPSQIHISNHSIHIGAWNAKEEGSPLYSNFFNGTIDEVKIYNRALSAEEILADYQGEVFGTLTGTVTDKDTGAPIEGALIEANSHQTITNSTGDYIITNLLPGNYTVTASKEGYYSNTTTAEILENQTTTLNFQLTKDTTPPAISNITTTSITSHSAVLSWQTNEPSTSLIKYGTSPGSYTHSKADFTLTTSHIVTLTNLIPNTTYYFVVNSTDASGNSNQSSEYNFTTKNVTLPVRLNLSALNSANEVILGTIIKIYKEGFIFDEGILNTTNKWKEVKNLEEESEVDIEYELPSKVKLRIRNLNMTKNLTLVPVFVSNYTGELLSFVSIKSSVIALNDSGLNYEGSEITLPISGSINRILHCVNWNFSSSNCLQWQLHNLSDYNHTLNSTHIIFNVSSFDAYGAGYIDNIPPEITLVYPENKTTLSAGTTQVTIKIQTNENATCRYSTNSSFNFSDGTNFTTTGGLNHSFLYTDLSNGKSYNLYYKCNDTNGNVNSNPVHHFFSVAEKEEGGGSSGGGGGGGGYPSTSNKIVVENKGAIIKIEIYLNKSVSNPSLKVEQISTIKIQKPKGTVYQYFNMTKRNFNNSIIKNSTIEFRVNNSWIKENGIKSVYLAKYENGWIKLKTELINKTENYTYYRSETNSFSYFAIVGEKEIKICEEGKKRCSNNNLEQCINNSWQLIETCNYGCNETNLTCNPKPTEKICEEGTKRCFNSKLQICENNNWQTIETCDYGCNETTLECNPPKKPEKRNYYILVILVIIGGALSYLWRDKIKDFLKRIRTERMEKRKPELQKTEETITKSEKSELEEIENKIKEVEEKIREMKKNGKDTAEIELELKTAKEDLDFGLHVLAKDRINRILEKLKE